MTVLRILILGASFDQWPIIQRAVAQGHHVIAIDGNPNATGFQFAHKHYVVSTRDKEACLSIAQSENIDAATYMITESPVLTIRHLTEHLGIPGPSIASAESTISKLRMRQILSENDFEFQPKYGTASTIDTAQAVANRIGYPVVLKPSDLGGQIGLAKINNSLQLATSFIDAASASLSGEVIIEQFMDGREINIVAAVMHGEIKALTVSDRVTNPDIAFGVVQEHHYPSVHGSVVHERVYSAVKSLVRAFGVENAILFPQMMVINDVPMLIEYGERVPGGVMKELFEYATGVDLIQFQLDIALSQLKPDFQDYIIQPPQPAVVVHFMNASPGGLTVGVVDHAVGREKAIKMPGIRAANYYNDPTQPQQIRPLIVGRDRFYYLLATGDALGSAVMNARVAAAVLDFAVWREGRLISSKTGCELDESGASQPMPKGHRGGSKHD